MSIDGGMSLFQSVAERILAQFLAQSGYSDVTRMHRRSAGVADAGVDLAYRHAGHARRVKVKPDAYFGTDPTKVHDRDLLFYRSEAGHYAFESISNNMTREPGWMFNSEADELFYYYMAIAQSEEEVRALLAEPDDVFFGEIKVERDELRILPMRETREWFERVYEAYTPRPVMFGDRTAWYRLIPRSDLDANVPGVRVVGSAFSVASG